MGNSFFGEAVKRNTCLFEEINGLSNRCFLLEVEAKMELPCGGGREGSGVVGEANSYLYKFGGFDVMPNKLIVDVFWRMVLTEMMAPDTVAGELCILDYDGFTMAITGYCWANAQIQLNA